MNVGILPHMMETQVMPSENMQILWLRELPPQKREGCRVLQEMLQDGGEMKYPLNPVVIALIAIPIAAMVAFVSHPEPELTYCQEIAGFWGSNCCESCQKLGYEYLHHTFDHGGLFTEGVDDCFCKTQEGNSTQVY